MLELLMAGIVLLSLIGSKWKFEVPLNKGLDLPSKSWYFWQVWQNITSFDSSNVTHGQLSFQWERNERVLVWPWTVSFVFFLNLHGQVWCLSGHQQFFSLVLHHPFVLKTHAKQSEWWKDRCALHSLPDSHKQLAVTPSWIIIHETINTRQWKLLIRVRISSKIAVKMSLSYYSLMTVHYH